MCVSKFVVFELLQRNGTWRRNALKKMTDEWHKLVDAHEGLQMMMDGLYLCEDHNAYCAPYAKCDCSG